MKTNFSMPRSASFRRGGFTLVELLVVLAIIGLLASLLLPAISRAKRQATNTVCVSQLRQLGIATRMYADDHEERLPSAELLPSHPVDAARPLPRISNVLGAYAGRAATAATNAVGPAVFQCPGDRVGRYAAEGSSYEWNVELNGHRLDETRTDKMMVVRLEVIDGEPAHQSSETRSLQFPPEITPLFLDYEDFHPRPPKPGKNVVFMDGHVDALSLASMGAGS